MALALCLVAQLATTATHEFDPSDQFAAAFATAVSAGDVNGDGFDDVLAGAPSWDGTGFADEGRAYLFLGSSSGLSSTPAWTQDPTDQAGARFGAAVAGLGDVNGDGFDDVAIGAPNWDSGVGGDEGRVYVYFGSASGLGTTPTTLDPTDQAAALFGTAVAAAGDIDGDGRRDLLVGAPGWSDGFVVSEGRAFLFYGTATGISPTPSWWADPTDQFLAGFGRALAGAADINGDGFHDLAIAAPGWDDITTIDEGRVYVYLGSSAGPAGAPLTLDPTDQSSAAFGSAVAFAGDVNADTFADLIVGAPNWDSASFADEGRAYVFLGSSTGLAGTPTWTADPLDQAQALFGSSVAGPGDVTGDGIADVAVGAPGWNNQQTAEGRAFLFLGSASGPAAGAGWSVEPTDQLDAHFGAALAAAGDTNGDGGQDLVVAAPDWDSTAFADEGRLYVYRGTAPSDSTSPATVADLAAAASGTSVTLTWTAPGDDGSTGSATSYDVRYSTAAAITDANWSSATAANSEPTPGTAGTTESFTIPSLTAGTQYWFAVRATDDAGNAAATSNSPSATTGTATSSSDATAPAAITDLKVLRTTGHELRIEWTAPGDDGATGTATKYHIRYSKVGPIDTTAHWDAATGIEVTPTPAPAGIRQGWTVHGLRHSDRYWVAIRTDDEVPNTSDLSNSPSGKTERGDCSASAPRGGSLALAALAVALFFSCQTRRRAASST